MAELIPGIHHIEFWVTDWKNSLVFYKKLFAAIGWEEHGPTAFTCGTCTIYFTEHSGLNEAHVGPRHICFQAVSRQVVERVSELAVEEKLTIIRGPVEMPHYSPGYYTFDFKDPDGYVLEVAHIPA